MSKPRKVRDQARSGMTRREAVSGAALLGIGASLDHVLSGPLGLRTEASAPTVSRNSAVPFHGPHQAGIATPAQSYMHFAAFDLANASLIDLRSLLQRWTAAAAMLTAGRLYQTVLQQPDENPEDTGEAVGLGASELTLTFGFGPGLFESPGLNASALAHRRPAELAELPPFKGAHLDPARSGGDLCVQACANNPQVAFHAIHVLSRVAAGTAAPRWSQLGFGRTSSTSRSQSTPRNLMGFKDGTDNIRAEDAGAMTRFVWVQAGDGPEWMAGGTYLIARRIRMLFDVWDATSLEGQERVIGRHKASGAPLGERNEDDPVDLTAVSAGASTIPSNAHIRLANPRYNNGQRILRRGYSYSEGTEAATGEIDAGLFFIAFQRSPRRQFIPLQRRLAASDALNEHTMHTSSAIFACPPGVRSGGFIGEGLFA
jgi:deferrochelatase/peroxidase EfeB